MVLIIGGYPISWDKAKVWALCHWLDMDIHDHESLASIIQHYHRRRGRQITCVPVEINKESLILFVVCAKDDPLSTPRKHRQFPESEAALKFKALLFSHKEDKELVEKS